MYKKTNNTYPQDVKKLQKTFRIRDEIIKLYKFLEFYGVNNNIAKDDLFDVAINYSLDLINTKKVTYFYNFSKAIRTVKGFTMTEETKNRIFKFYHCQNEYKKGEVVELLISIYALKHLSQSEFKNFNICIKLDTLN